jgi:hypothetical protein
MIGEEWPRVLRVSTVTPTGVSGALKRFDGGGT